MTPVLKLGFCPPIDEPRPAVSVGSTRNGDDGPGQERRGHRVAHIGVAILDGGIVAPGSSPGTLTVNDTFTLADASILNFEFNAVNNAVGGGINDLIAGVTDLTLDGILKITGSNDWTNVADNTAGRVFNSSGTLIDNGLSIGVQPTLGAGQSLRISTATPGQVNLVIVRG